MDNNDNLNTKLVWIIVLSCVIGTILFCTLVSAIVENEYHRKNTNIQKTSETNIEDSTSNKGTKTYIFPNGKIVEAGPMDRNLKKEIKKISTIDVGMLMYLKDIAKDLINETTDNTEFKKTKEQILDLYDLANEITNEWLNSAPWDEFDNDGITKDFEEIDALNMDILSEIYSFHLFALFCNMGNKDAANRIMEDFVSKDEKNESRYESLVNNGIVDSIIEVSIIDDYMSEFNTKWNRASIIRN